MKIHKCKPMYDYKIKLFIIQKIIHCNSSTVHYRFLFIGLNDVYKTRMFLCNNAILKRHNYKKNSTFQYFEQIFYPLKATVIVSYIGLIAHM